MEKKNRVCNSWCIGLVLVVSIVGCGAKTKPSAGREDEAATCSASSRGDEKGLWVNRVEKSGLRIEGCFVGKTEEPLEIEGRRANLKMFKAKYEKDGRALVETAFDLETKTNKGPMTVFLPDGRRFESEMEASLLTGPWVERSADGRVTSSRCYLQAKPSYFAPFDLEADDASKPSGLTVTLDSGVDPSCKCPAPRERVVPGTSAATPTAPKEQTPLEAKAEQKLYSACLTSCAKTRDTAEEAKMMRACKAKCGDDVACMGSCELKNGATTGDRCALGCREKYPNAAGF